MSVDISMFDTRTMLTALEQSKPATTFLLDLFFPVTAPVHTTKAIDIDIVDKTGRRMAAFVSPRVKGKVLKKQGFKTKTYVAPYIKEKTVTTAADIIARPAGTTIYSPGESAATRAGRELGNDLAELRERITRRQEWMASQLLETGAMAITGDGIDDYIDFGMKSTHKVVLSGAALWTASTSDPIKDLEDWCQITGQDSGFYPRDCVMGNDVYQAFRKNPVVLAYLENRRIEIGMMAPKQMGNGVNFVFRLESCNLNIWTYAESYFDEETEIMKFYVPTDKLFLGNGAAYTRRHFGLIEDLEASAAVPYFPKTWIEKDPSCQMVMLQSAPLVAMHQVDAFLVATPVVVTP